VGLKATLRPYQKDGYDWMIRLYHWKKGACLADDMGLGKTVQTLATLLKLASEGPALVFAPTSLVNNWQRESQKFTPELRVHIYRDSLRTTEQIQSYGPGDLVIASYGLVLRDIGHFEAALWNAVIYDEAQALKNANAKTSKAMQKLKANWQLALSGTPIENHLGDLWSLFRTISPEILGGWTRFQRSYLFPIVKGQSEKAADRLQKRISPFILRRMKKDYLKDLPTKTTIDLNIDLSEDEQKIYDALRLDAIKMLETKANDDDSLQDEMESEAASEAKKRMQILSVLTRLRLSVLHPKLVHPDWKQGSSKLMAFLSLCQQALSNGHRILVFSQFTKLLELVQDELIKLNVSHTYLDGSLSGKERSQRVEAFQAGEFDVFLISLKAGGTGLTLTKADFVVHLDPWWNPAVQEQATDRVYRIGQKNPVTVYRLIVNNSIEEQIMRLQQDKSDLAEQILDTKRAIRVDKMLELLR
jgi:SNF2 family DNA or RNA helicase